MNNAPPASFLDQLQSRLNCHWASITKARGDSEQMRADLQQLFRELNSPDTSIVVFGSVARGEVTQSSDLDWILLVDGQSVPEHKDQLRRVEETLSQRKYIEPGKSGVFGTMVGSHELVHNIGGEDDSNSNTTRRVLLLLESLPVGDSEAYARVRLQILRRYLEDDRGLLHGSGTIRIPRFLLNDITRYWRTVTVDFVYKQRADRDKKWALRNAKLRMSRKLVFAAGLLHCFFCHLDDEAAAARTSLTSSGADLSLFLQYVQQQLALDPLETLAKACVRLDVSSEAARRIFDSYDAFLAILDDETKRTELAEATHANLRSSNAWREVREISHPFHEGLVSLFFEEDKRLSKLTKAYGLF